MYMHGKGLAYDETIVLQSDSVYDRIEYCRRSRCGRLMPTTGPIGRLYFVDGNVVLYVTSHGCAFYSVPMI